MRILGLALICFWFGFAESCEKVCAKNFKPMCGYDGQCYTEAVNACYMRNINCVRAAKENQVNELQAYRFANHKQFVHFSFQKIAAWSVYKVLYNL